MGTPAAGGQRVVWISHSRFPPGVGVADAVNDSVWPRPFEAEGLVPRPLGHPHHHLVTGLKGNDGGVPVLLLTSLDVVLLILSGVRFSVGDGRPRGSVTRCVPSSRERQVPPVEQMAGGHPCGGVAATANVKQGCRKLTVPGVLLTTGQTDS
jgi:hypothetical protein